MPADPSLPPSRFGNAPWGWEAWLASGLGLGRSPIVPGTVGTLWGVPLTWGLHQLGSPALSAVILIGLWLAGVPVCTRAASKAEKKDPGWIVWDEWVTLPWVTWGLATLTPGMLVGAFVLHRVCDIVKPPPARWLERLPGGWGIMADDLIAALYAAVLLRICLSLGQ